TELVKGVVDNVEKQLVELETFGANQLAGLKFAAAYNAGTQELRYMINRFSRLASAMASQPQAPITSTNLSFAVNLALNNLEQEINQRSTVIKTDIASNLNVPMQQNDLIYVIGAIIKNAVQFSPDA